MTLVLENVVDPHNMSAVLRTCEAFGIQDVHLVTHGTPLPAANPAVTLGAERWLTLHHHDDGVAVAIAALRALGYRLFVGHLSAEATPLSDLPRDERAAYVLGSERTGISPPWLEAADARFLIPTCGFTGSLNLSVAAAVIVYDRLGRETGAAGDLSAGEKAALRTTWYAALAHGSATLERDFAAHAEHPPAPAQAFPIDRRKP